jgi:hypothetical protein
VSIRHTRHEISGGLPRGSRLRAPEYLDIARLRTNAGADFQAAVMGATTGTGIGTGAFAPANFIGVTANTAAASATSTVLTGEVTTGTLARAQAVYAHTTGTSTYTLTKTFTSDQAITLHRVGVFNGATGSILVFESVLNADAVLTNGDQLTITETVSL